MSSLTEILSAMEFVDGPLQKNLKMRCLNSNFIQSVAFSQDIRIV